jgi:surface protein
MLKKLSPWLLIIFVLGTFAINIEVKAAATDHFVTTWKTDNSGSSNSTSITIPTHPGSTYAYQVDWNNDQDFLDVNETTINTGDVTYDFGVAGTYTIRITGTFPRIYFANTGDDEQKIIRIDQWGTNPWTSMESAFTGTSNLSITATDTPNLAGVTSLLGMFAGSGITTNAAMRNWDTSNIQSMDFMFNIASNFNEDISGWDTSSVTSMFFMLNGTSFNYNIGGWDITNVTDASGLLNNTPMSINNYTATLIGFESQNVQTGIPFGAQGLVFCPSADTPRSNLILNKGWSITDLGMSTSCSEIEFSEAYKFSSNETTADNFAKLLVKSTITSARIVQVIVDPSSTATGGGVDYTFASPTNVTIPAGTYDGTIATAIDIPLPTLVPDGLTEAVNETIVFKLQYNHANSDGLSTGDANGDTNIVGTFTYEINDQAFDSDGDGVFDPLEEENGGDTNGDSIPDKNQQNVMQSLLGTVPANVTFVATGGGCEFINGMDYYNENTLLLDFQDKLYDYPIGLMGFSLACGSAGATTTVKIIFDKVYDTSKAVLRKNKSGVGFTNVEGGVTFAVENINGSNKTTVTYSLTDGGINDDDGIANGNILDPVGFGIPVTNLSATGMNIQSVLTLSIAGLVIVFSLAIGTFWFKGRRN